MFVYKRESLFSNIVVIIINAFSLLFFFIGMFSMAKIPMNLGVLFLIFICSIGCAWLSMNYALRNTDFDLTKQSEIQKREAFKWILFVVELSFYFLFGLSIAIGVQLYNSMSEGWEWTIFTPSVVFLINAFYAPNLHPLLFDSALS